MHRKTALIMTTALGLIAAAGIVSAQHKPSPTQPLIATGPVEPNDCGVKTAIPSQARADFGAGTLAANLSGAHVLYASPGEMYLAVDLTTHDAKKSHRAPLNVAIVIDRSGSMQGEKLVQAKEAAKGLVARLTDRDRVALVQYDDSAQLLVPQRTADGQAKEHLYGVIDRITDAGGTNLHDGMALGRDEVMKTLAEGRINRVILLSDGQANVGITDTPTLAQIASVASEKGVRITTVGLGVDYNEDLMEAIAENGRGQYYYVRDASTLQAVFAGELDAMQATVAQKATLRLSPTCDGSEIVEVYGYTWRREGNAVIVPLADLTGGEARKILVRVKVPTQARGHVRAVEAVLTFDEADGKGHKTARVALGVQVTSETALIESSANKEVLAKVEKVETATTLRKAAEAYDKGDVSGAQQLIGAQRSKTEGRARAYGLSAGATAPMYQELDEMSQGVSTSAPGSAAGKALVKGKKMGARGLSK
jgi:Ca-activated chloride channel family protein